MTNGGALHEMVYTTHGNPADYRIIDVNPAIETIIGTGRENVIGKTSTEAYGVDAPPFLDRYARVAATGHPETFEEYFAPMEKHFAISVYSPEKGKFVTIFDDVTSYRQTDAALRESEEQLATIINAAQIGIIIVDAESHMILRANNKALELIGASEDEVTGQHLPYIHLPGERGRCPVTDLKEDINSSERVLVTKDGSLVPIIKTVVTAQLKNKKVLVESFIDISERKRMEDALRESEKKFRGIFDTINDGIHIHDIAPGRDAREIY